MLFTRSRRGRPALSVVVVVHDMARELPRTLRSLSTRHQIGIDTADHEVIVVDNGSPEPVHPSLLDRFDGAMRLETVVPAPPSPARAANRGIALARGDLIGLFIDGARLASPGLLAGALRASTLAPRPVITATAWHLGETTHMRAAEVGYDQEAEDVLLSASGWEEDGYRLFDVSTLAGSSHRGIFGVKGESNSLFMPRTLWKELDGLDERFELPGGGLANHDLYRRACSLPDVELVELLGEGTFHQYHGGAATSRRFSFDDMQADYQRIRGERYTPPANAPLFLGRVHPAVLPHVSTSAQSAIDRGPRRPPASSTERRETTS